MRILPLLLLATLWAGPFNSQAWEFQYVVVPIESERLPYVGATIAADISDGGWITGVILPGLGSPSGGYETVFSYQPSTGFVDLGNVPGYNTIGGGINDRGEIAGAVRQQEGRSSFLYVPGGGFTLVGGQGSSDYIGASSINAGGTLAGSYPVAEGEVHAFRYSAGTGLRDLGTLGGANSYGYNINDAGWVVGTSQTGDGSWHAFLYRDDVGMLDLGPGYASGINNLGVAAGISDGRPVVFREGAIIPLGGGLALFGYVSDINDQGVVVGGYDDLHTGWRHTFVGTETDGLVDLNSLIDPASGWRMPDALGINNAGQIVGIGAYQGSAWAVRLDPVPEPSTWALFGLGAALLWAVHRRRSKRRGGL